MVASTYRAFAVLTKKGNVYAWGQGSFGGDIENKKEVLQSGVITKIRASTDAFAAIRKNDCHPICWGGISGGSMMDSDVSTVIYLFFLFNQRICGRASFPDK